MTEQLEDKTYRDSIARQNECEMPECSNSDDLKACRDPEDNLIEMCPRCRSEWPVTEVEA